jgi:hypothetical protein
MENTVTFLDCPAYLGGDRTVRCGLPAEVEERYSASSTDGPLDSARIRCPRGHWFNGHIESLTMLGQPAAAGVSAWQFTAPNQGGTGGGPDARSHAHIKHGDRDDRCGSC